MKDGFIKVAAVTPDIKVADCEFNANQIIKRVNEARGNGAKIIVFPELCVCAYTLGDLFLQASVLKAADDAVFKIAEETKDVDALIIVGAPVINGAALYNCAVFINKGRVIGAVPKSNLANYNEFYELRHFTPAPNKTIEVLIAGQRVPFGTELLFCCDTMPNLSVCAEICEDLWAPKPPSIDHAINGASVIVNLSASDELTGKSEYRRELVKGQSARLVCAYLYAAAGEGESTTDMVFCGHNIIAENGIILSETSRFKNGIAYADVDVDRLWADRRRMNSFPCSDEYNKITFSLQLEDTKLSRLFAPYPFVPFNEKERFLRCEEILTIQALGLKKRLLHTKAKTAVIGLSGGLDSTLALLVTLRAFDMAELDRAGIIAVTMPCFGTTDNTYNNAVELARETNVSFMEIPLRDSVTAHLNDIGHDINSLDITYENAQARERTQVLMDLANKNNGLVIGTGDLSELAMGWATYNGDHMSMYGVNSSIPKTLVRHLVKYYAQTSTPQLSKLLSLILDTPVSPELLPPKDGIISQRTEDIIGPYELHDFFLYYMIRFGMPKEKIFRMACIAFVSEYMEETISKWQDLFYKRFYASQFKRSCLPDGPKVGSIALSPRGDWRMPSDAVYNLGNINE